MKITVSAQDLKETLNISQSTLGSQPDITSHFIFTSEDTGANVMSCSPPRQFSKIPLVGATVQGEGSFSVEGKRLLPVVSVAKGVLEISYDQETKSVQISSDANSKAKGNVGSLDPSSFPPWASKLSQAVLLKKVSSSVLYDCLNTNKRYVSIDDSRRPELAMLLIDDGKSFACDGFMLGIARHEELKDLNVKIHFKDISPLMKFLKAYEGNMIEVLNGGQATFFRAEDGASFGIMDLPHTFPPITAQYADSFDWIPRRVWRLNKEVFVDAISFLSAFADSTDYRVTFIDPEDELLLPPRLEMKSSNGNENSSFNLEVPPFENEEKALEDFTQLSELMYATRKRESGEGEDIASFDFNFMAVKKALEICNENVVFGCNVEGKKGYMLFKSDQESGVQTVSIIGWML